MTKYIERDKAVKPIFLAADTGRAANALSLLGKESVADVVEVVRCKDCRHKQVDEIIFALSANPETALFCKRMGGIISETFYCAAGERMDGDQQCK